MLKEKLFTIWRFSLPFLFVFVLIHFLKDITQDILRIATPLDILGDAKEDLSVFPEVFRHIYYAIGIGSFFAEVFLLFSVPIVLKRQKVSYLEKAVLTITILLLTYFFIAITLDPKYRNWLINRL